MQLLQNVLQSDVITEAIPKLFGTNPECLNFIPPDALTFMRFLRSLDISISYFPIPPLFSGLDTSTFM